MKTLISALMFLMLLVLPANAGVTPAEFARMKADVAKVKAMNWHVAASITWSETALADSATFAQVSSSSLTLVNKSLSGIVTAMIPCSGGNVPSGTTCSAGNEVTGIAYTQAEAAPVEVCFAGTVYGTYTTSSSFLQVNEINAAGTILQTGAERVIGVTGGGIQAAETTAPRICEQYNVSSGQVIFALYYKKAAGQTMYTAARWDITVRPLYTAF